MFGGKNFLKNSGLGKELRRSVMVSIIIGVMVLAPMVAIANPENNPPTGKGPKTLDDRFLEVGSNVPEFGGMFKDGDVMKVYLVNPAKRTAAEAAIHSVFGRESIPRGGIQVLQGRYGFSQLKEWHDLTGGLFNIEGIVFTDVDERNNRLRVGVESSDLSGIVEQELKKHGIPRYAFVVEQVEPVMFASTLQQRIRPLNGGIQIAFQNNPAYYYACTLGFNGVRSEVNGFVVNSHCTYKQGGVEGTVYYQPTPVANNRIGTEIADPIYTKQKCPPRLKGKVCRWSDSAYAQGDPGVEQSLGLIEKLESRNTGSLNIAGSFQIISEGASITGETVNKVGRTTGWTQGTVTATCVNVGVSGTKIVQLCQDFVNAGVGSGDSGSPVFSITDSPLLDDVELRGILWGSSGGTSFVYSPIANIQRSDELGIITNCGSGLTC